MKKLFPWLFTSADRYLRASDWKDIALIKLCLFAIGLLAGMQVRESDKKAVRAGAAALFVVTYIPLMSKYIGVQLVDAEQTK